MSACRPDGYHIAVALGYAFGAAPAWDRASLVSAGRKTLGRGYRWLHPLVREVLAVYPHSPVDRPAALAELILGGDALQRGLENARASHRPVRVVSWQVQPTQMGRRRWPVPVIDDLVPLARLLELPPEQLTWLADRKGLQRREPAGPYQPYRYQWVVRSHAVPRLIEAPTPILRAVLRRLLHEVLVWVPSHPAAHGFVPGRSALTHARQHVGADVVVSLDLRHFFNAITGSRVAGLFRSMGYPEPVALTLTGLVTNQVPAGVLTAMPPGGDSTARHRLRAWLRSPHLPQGAPTSPSLANLVCFTLDARLAGYAAVVGARYSRYADDLAFSGAAELRSSAGRFVRRVSDIAAEEGFLVHPTKTRVQRSSGRQLVTGIVVNSGPGIVREDYDRLRALLHEARTAGTETANRELHPDFRRHLLGRVSWVESVNPVRGIRLREQLDALVWPGDQPPH